VEGSPTPTRRRPLPGATGLHRTQFPILSKGKIRIENQRRFSVFLFPTLKSIASTLEANAALVGRKIFDFKTMGKKVIERHTEKLLIYAAIRAIGKRG
jgi:hypothetical protein